MYRRIRKWLRDAWRDLADAKKVIDSEWPFIKPTEDGEKW